MISHPQVLAHDGVQGRQSDTPGAEQRRLPLVVAVQLAQ